ncbi:MAG TPA: STAS domain-containing protein [Acidobacteriaceae bacterium]|nr:STAS domain-containing protein [Acidobacteriaceae bacterium]
MTLQIRTVAVMQLPEVLNSKQRRNFLREVQSHMNVDRPRMVLDCSNVKLGDRSFIHLLLCCLEEAMKCKGDVKLAALPPGAGAILELTGVSRLFDIYETTAEAVHSFHRFPVMPVRPAHVTVAAQGQSETAA